jgi:hypothetical protein
MFLRLAQSGPIHLLMMTAVAAGCLAAACRRPSADVTVLWDVADTLHTGPSQRVRFALRDGARQPVRGATLTVEAHMAHPGMAPAVAAARETAAGRYEALLPLSMAGDWILVVSGSLPDGTRVTLEQPVEIRSAAPAS